MALHVATREAPELEQLRSDHRVRVVNKEEEGSNIYRLPDGVYGFTYAPGLKEVPVYAKPHYQIFEVHRLTGGSVHLIGFVTPDVKAKIDGAKEAIQVAIYPDRWEGATELVSIADSRLQPAKKAVTREDGNPFRTLVFPGS